jgi:hypothetical protein
MRSTKYWMRRGVMVVAAALWLAIPGNTARVESAAPAAPPPQGPNLIQNGDFSNGTAGWLQFATPNQSYMVSAVVNGVFEFHRLAPPPGTTNQATIFQETGVTLGSHTPVASQFDLGNSSAVRKRISVLMLDSNFSDLAVCTFWLEPNAPLRTYGMRTHSNRIWANAALYFYAASTGANGGNYQIDNVSMNVGAASQPISQTDCLDPMKPAAVGNPAGPDMIVNGSFASGLSPWGVFGQINHRIANGVFEFQRPPGTPAGVVLQPTGTAVGAGQIVTATFDLGNSSPVRKRVTALLHDNDFTDLTACTFYMAPGQPLLPYSIQSFTTKAWANATLSIYPATVGPEQWFRLDRATLRATPATPTTGTNCLEFGSLGPGAHPPGLLGTHNVGPAGTHSTFLASVDYVSGAVTDIGASHGTLNITDSVVDPMRRLFIGQEGPILYEIDSITGALVNTVALSSPFGLSHLKYERTSGRVLGIHSVPAGPSQAANAFLSVVDTDTGAILHVGPGIGNVNVSSAAVDPINQLFFALGEGPTLWVIDTITGLPIRSVVLSSSVPVQEMQFETSTNQLLGLHTTTSGAPPVTSTSLAVINTTTGVISYLGASLGNPSLGYTALDPVQHLFFAEDIAGPTLWVLDTLTGAVVRTVGLSSVFGVTNQQFVRSPLEEAQRDPQPAQLPASRLRKTSRRR